MVDDADTFSLADLADLDVTDIQELRFENLPAGAYRFAVESVAMTEGLNKQTNDKQFVVEFKFNVVECKAVMERGVDKESLVGKKHVEKRYIKPQEAAEGIGYLRAFVTDIGGNSAGRLGGVAGKEPGFLDEAVGLEFDGKISSKPDKDDPSIKYARLRVDAKK